MRQWQSTIPSLGDLSLGWSYLEDLILIQMSYNDFLKKWGRDEGGKLIWNREEISHDNGLNTRKHYVNNQLSTKWAYQSTGGCTPIYIPVARRLLNLHRSFQGVRSVQGMRKNRPKVGGTAIDKVKHFLFLLPISVAIECIWFESR